MASRFETRISATGNGFDQLLSAHGESVSWKPVTKVAETISAIRREERSSDPRNRRAVWFVKDGALSIDPRAKDQITADSRVWNVTSARQKDTIWTCEAVLPETEAY